MCPSTVQALSKHVQAPNFSVQACKKRLGKVYKSQHKRVQAFRPTGLFIILKWGRTRLWLGAGTPRLSTLHSHLWLQHVALLRPAFLEFYPPRLARCKQRKLCGSSQTEETTLPTLFQSGESASSVCKKSIRSVAQPPPLSKEKEKEQEKEKEKEKEKEHDG